MASNISKRLDRIERIANELLNQSNPPVYIKGDDPEPEGEYVRVVREYVAAPERPDLTLLPLSEPAGNLFGADGRKPLRDFHGPLEFPKQGVA